FARTAGWWVNAQKSSVDDAGLPHFVPDLSLACWALLDELVLATIRFRHRPRTEEEMLRIEQEVADAVALYSRMGWLDDPMSYHVTPTVPRDAALRSTRGPGPRFEI